MSSETSPEVKLERAAEAEELKVTMNVYDDFQSCAELANRWDDFVARTSGDIFQTYDWCRIWWKYYGSGRLLRIYLFQNADQWTGLVPMFVENVSLGPLTIRRAKMVGSDYSFGHFRPAVEPDCLEEVFSTVTDDLFDLGCDQVLIGPLAGRYEHSGKLMNLLRKNGDGRYISDELIYMQIYYQLEETYDQWLKIQKSDNRKKINRDYRKLEKNPAPFVIECADESSIEEMFNDFVELHRQNWKDQGKLGHFDDWPHSLEFHRELAEELVRDGRLQLLRLGLYDGSRVYAYNFRFTDMYFEYLTARTFFSPDKVSLARILHAETIRRAENESVRWMDSMQGYYSYKVELGGKCLPQRLAVLSRSDRRMRIALFRAAASLLHLVYYKVFFCRLASYIPLKRRRRLRDCWIRACGERRNCLDAKEVEKLDKFEVPAT